MLDNMGLYFLKKIQYLQEKGPLDKLPGRSRENRMGMKQLIVGISNHTARLKQAKKLQEERRREKEYKFKITSIKSHMIEVKNILHLNRMANHDDEPFEKDTTSNEDEEDEATNIDSGIPTLLSPTGFSN